MHRLQFHFVGMGDQIATTSFPENYYNATGNKVIITDKRIWAFEHNPYVVFMEEEEARDYPVLDLIPDCRGEAAVKHFARVTNSLAAASQAEYMCTSIGIKDVRLRHSKLYIYDDERIVPNKIVVHTTGSDRTRIGEAAIRTASGEDELRIMSAEVMGSILKNYADWQIVQVGGPEDRPLGGHSVDLRGRLDYWQVAKEIATSARFIGVNSGPMHIANCYPRVDKRIVLMEFPRQTLLKYKPGDIRNALFSWIDPANIFFNRFNDDVGFTFSRTKL